MKHPPATALALLLAATLAPSALADPSVPACVKWGSLPVSTPTGYNHVVWIENTCDKTAACTVATDVAPDPIQASVSSKQKVELTTFRGSPTYAFKAKVACKLE